MCIELRDIGLVTGSAAGAVRSEVTAAQPPCAAFSLVGYQDTECQTRQALSFAYDVEVTIGGRAIIRSSVQEIGSEQQPGGPRAIMADIVH